MLNNSHVYWKISSVGTSRLPIPSNPSPNIAITLDLKGRRAVELFYHLNTSGFLHLPLVCRKGNTSRPLITGTPRANLVTSGNRAEVEWPWVR
jgi:hypothetical protein